MKRWLLIALVCVGACSDSGVGPNANEAISIYLDADRVSEATVVEGDSIVLTLRLRDSDAEPGTRVEWESEDPSIVRLSRPTTESVVVHGESFGSARVIATAGALADTVAISVLASPANGWCDTGGLVLEVGGSVTTTSSAARHVCLAPVPGAGAEYIVVPFHAATAASRMRVEVSATGIVASTASGSIAPTGEEAVPVELIQAESSPDLGDEFERRLRERELRELSPRVTGAGREAVAFSRIAADVPSVGELVTINVNAEETCSNPIQRQARVTAVGSRSILLEDISNPPGGFSVSEYQNFATTFDQLIYPTLTENFGTPTDIDGNQRVIVVFTREVNELTPRGSEGYVAGFFYARDLFPRRASGGLEACATSNEGEILYMLAPDPNGTINGNVRSREMVGERTSGIMGHELQHLISASRRLHMLGADGWQEVFWLNEGLSHIAEELVFYAASGLGPRQEITIDRIRNTSGGITRFNQYQASNFGRYAQYLREPEDASPISGTELATRGAAWSYLRYLADRRDAPEKEFWKSLIDTEKLGYANLLSALGVSPLAWMHDWAVSLYADDHVPDIPSRFRQRSWNHRSMMPAITTNNNRYPLTVEDLRPQSSTAALDLPAGGTAIVRFGAPGGEPVSFEVRSGSGQAPPALRYTIMRTR